MVARGCGYLLSPVGLISDLEEEMGLVGRDGSVGNECCCRLRWSFLRRCGGVPQHHQNRGSHFMQKKQNVVENQGSAEEVQKKCRRSAEEMQKKYRRSAEEVSACGECGVCGAKKCVWSVWSEEVRVKKCVERRSSCGAKKCVV